MYNNKEKDIYIMLAYGSCAEMPLMLHYIWVISDKCRPIYGD